MWARGLAGGVRGEGREGLLRRRLHCSGLPPACGPCSLASNSRYVLGFHSDVPLLLPDAFNYTRGPPH